jgi:hypothetical protein
MPMPMMTKRMKVKRMLKLTIHHTRTEEVF